MVDMSQAFEGEYLSAKDYDEGDNLVLTIRSVTQKEFEDRDTGEQVKKHVLHFNERNPGLVLNKSNGRTLIGLYGNDSDAWIGKAIGILVASSPVGPWFKIKDKEPKAGGAKV